MPRRATLASAISSFLDISTPLLITTTANPQRPSHDLFSSLEEVERLLDLFAHVERVDDKLMRSARKISADESLLLEQKAAVGKYTREGEGRKKRRMVYIGWSIMLRRAVSFCSASALINAPLLHLLTLNLRSRILHST